MALLSLFDSLLFTSILVRFHLYQFTSLSVFSLRSSVLQLCEVIILDSPLEYFPTVAYQILLLFGRNRGWEECKGSMRVPMLSGITYLHKLER